MKNQKVISLSYKKTQQNNNPARMEDLLAEIVDIKRDNKEIKSLLRKLLRLLKAQNKSQD